MGTLEDLTAMAVMAAAIEICLAAQPLLIPALPQSKIIWPGIFIRSNH